MKSGLYIISGDKIKAKGLIDYNFNISKIFIAALCISSLVITLLFLYSFSFKTEKCFEYKNDENIDPEPDQKANYSKAYVTTKSGKIQGKRYDVLNTKVDMFLGIPFAEPPIGHLRFQKPLEVQPWKGILKAYDYSPPCVQYKLKPVKQTPWTSMRTQSEDCLYLNIWSPIMAQNNTKFKTVMIFIYGGAFISGSSDVDYYDGRILSAFGDVVIVTLNYRLSIFGFLNANDESAPGNVGLLDQVLAMKWIQNNIMHFGGDPLDITLFGESAGAISIGFHMLSPMSKDLFKRAILQSGSPLMPSVLEEQQLAIERANKIAENVGCADHWISLIDKPELVVNCLKTVNAMKLIEEEENLMEGFHPPLNVAIGDDFMPINPYEVFKNGEIGNQKEVMIGTNADEGSFFLHYTYPDIFSSDFPKNITAEEAVVYLENSFKFLPQQMPKLITHFFMNGFDSKDYENIRKAFYDTIGDFIILCPTVFLSEKLAEKNINVYYYYFTYRPKINGWGKWMGITHFEEIQFVFGMPFRKPINYTTREREFSAQLMQMWTNFAKFGHPLNETQHKWPLYSFENKLYLELNLNNEDYKIGSGPHQTHCNLWRFIFDSAAPAK